MRARKLLRSAFVLVVALAGGAVCLAMPPQVAFEPRPLLGFAAILIGSAAALWPGSHRIVAAVRAAGVAALWLTIAWCVLSQPIPFSASTGVVLGQRALPVVLLAGVWTLLWLPRSWQRRMAAALFVPSVVGLTFAGWLNVPQTVDFKPDRLAIDSHGTLYVSDLDASVIRVFGADGTLRAKLWPGLASRQGPPGPGFSPTGPFNDPERIGLPPGISASGTTVGGVAWTPKSDPFQFCGLAVDGRDRLYVPDPKHGVMLRFGADGYLQARWSFPQDFQPSADCVAAAANRVYLADARGAVLALTPDGETLSRWPLPDAIGGVSVSPDSRRIYALSVSHIFALDTVSGAVAAWQLAAPSGGIVALPSGRVVVGDHVNVALDVYCPDGRLCAHMGTFGQGLGQFWQLGGLAADREGRLYVADFGNRAVQAFTPAGRLTALYWSIEDDEERGERRV